MVIFKETQGFSGFISTAILSGALVFGMVIVILQFSADMDPQTIRTLWIIWLVMALVDGAILSIRMVTEIRPDGVVVYCRPLRFLRREISWDAIEHVYARQYRPLAEYGGWGIRFGTQGTAYNMRGHQGIQFEMKQGQRLLIGTQQPEAFIEAVRCVGGPVK